MTAESGTKSPTERMRATLRRRYAAERRFQAYGIVAIVVALSMLVTLFVTIIGNGAGAFVQHTARLDISVYPQDIDPGREADLDALARANYQSLVNDALYSMFPEATSRQDRRAVRDLISPGAKFVIRDMVMDDPSLIGQRVSVRVPLSSQYDQVLKGNVDPAVDFRVMRESSTEIPWSLPEGERLISDTQAGYLQQLIRQGEVEGSFNRWFFTNGDSRQPELAGIWGAAVGSMFTLMVTLLLSFPIGVSAAIYLEEFAPKNRLTDIIEVNINNLAAVPSIVFGLLGLAVFLQFFGLPRSAPLVGGLVLTLMTLPTIIIASRAALKSVPPSIREAALGVGASKLQCIVHHVLPLAMPGMLTGTIIGMAQALGETAPLLMIGMVAFVVDVPGSPLDPSTVLPVQIYLWADSPERAFTERTSAAIMCLLGFLILMNAVAVLLRKRFERRW
ncbi:phosphate ABC transporter permease PstA [Roseospira visakhapatnamensis]|uniref:Phosphate transport system permease protein PstA n=1 Tax=Roseospira visakhapatnamensis TaxID=390880 RepID=A0A7W6WAW6_9PROT|nr:phosphate ABC transporter permease PstA [Roseospira visakhapatnamensis]MBB4267243.1 phosphate transport system permease protein [Roseospira visakhapatnamensis]